MKQELKKEMLKAIEITKESAKNSLEIAMESYSEITSKLDFMAYLLLHDEKSNSEKDYEKKFNILRNVPVSFRVGSS